MAVTKSIIQKSGSRTTIKIVGTAGADTSTITLKSTALTVGATGNVTFDPALKTITRASGDWVAAGFVPGTTLTLTGTTNNNKSFSVVSLTTTVLTVAETMVTEVAGAATIAAYNSDLSFPGQIFTTPKANITNVKYSLGGTCAVVRNTTTVLQLAGTWMANNDGFGLAEANDQNVVVTFGTSGGTIILELSKIDGFSTESSHVVN